MLKRAKSRGSSKFLSGETKIRKREVFPDGDWLTIDDDLAMSGWDTVQREDIHACLRRGMPLPFAVRQVAIKLGRCPIRSKSFF